MDKKHPVPEEYHALFAIGKIDRRGNKIDFNVPPVIIDSQLSISDYKKIIFDEHVSAESLPQDYLEAKKFVVIRPTALNLQTYIKKELEKTGLEIKEEFELDNFMKFADIVYSLDPKISFHWKWRVIMRALHDTRFQNQNKAVVFTLKDHENDLDVMEIKKRIRAELGETPVLIRYTNNPEIALGIHHLHSPDSERLATEYNVLMHARYKTSVFTTNPS